MAKVEENDRTHMMSLESRWRRSSYKLIGNARSVGDKPSLEASEEPDRPDGELYSSAVS